jgi:hypothetical protein
MYHCRIDQLPTGARQKIPSSLKHHNDFALWRPEAEIRINGSELKWFDVLPQIFCVDKGLDTSLTKYLHFVAAAMQDDG